MRLYLGTYKTWHCEEAISYNGLCVCFAHLFPYLRPVVLVPKKLIPRLGIGYSSTHFDTYKPTFMACLKLFVEIRVNFSSWTALDLY